MPVANPFDTDPNALSEYIFGTVLTFGDKFPWIYRWSVDLGVPGGDRTCWMKYRLKRNGVLKIKKIYFEPPTAGENLAGGGI